MKLRGHHSAPARATEHSRSESAFTMVEIALCLAIIAFALVAIIGVLPSGMTVQRDNRIDSIVNQDAQFWMNAIRSGAKYDPELMRHVLRIDGTAVADSTEIIGKLSRPMRNNKAVVRAISGSAVERDPEAIAFEYVLFSQISNVTNTHYADVPALTNNLYELRLTFRWPLQTIPGGAGGSTDDFGSGKKVYRTLISGQLVETNGLFFFQSQVFAR